MGVLKPNGVDGHTNETVESQAGVRSLRTPTTAKVLALLALVASAAGCGNKPDFCDDEAVAPKDQSPVCDLSYWDECMKAVAVPQTVDYPDGTDEFGNAVTTQETRVYGDGSECSPTAVVTGVEVRNRGRSVTDELTFDLDAIQVQPGIGENEYGEFTGHADFEVRFQSENPLTGQVDVMPFDEDQDMGLGIISFDVSGDCEPAESDPDACEYTVTMNTPLEESAEE